MQSTNADNAATSSSAGDGFEPASYRLSANDIAEIDGLLDELLTSPFDPDEPGCLAEAAIAAHALPVGVRRFLTQARLRDVPVFAVQGYRLDDRLLGPTPEHWSQTDSTGTVRADALLVLLASVLGDPYSVSVLQAGKMLNDVMPVSGSEATITAGSSETRLLWHTEEAGFDFRPDYQGFVCLRNWAQIPTMVVCTDWLDLDARYRRILREPRFEVAPWGDQREEWVRIPLMSGGDTTPYIRLDPVFTRAVGGDDEAAEALTELASAVDRAQRPLRHDAGDFFFIDNWRAVHGRDAYRPRYDGTDRWMKRIKITRTLRVSRGLRDSADDRVVAAERLL